MSEEKLNVNESVTVTEVEPKKQLTVSDPVDPQTLQALGQITEAMTDAAHRGMELDIERVRTVRQYNQLDVEKNRLFERVLLERGIAPTTPVTIDPKTGVITIAAKSEP